MRKVTLSKTKPASKYGDKTTPASYDVLVDGAKVGEMVGRCQGRNGNAHWHELRDLNGAEVDSTVEVRGIRREKLNTLALDLADNGPNQR